MLKVNIDYPVKCEIYETFFDSFRIFSTLSYLPFQVHRKEGDYYNF
jgi:hypothetical protein